MNDSEADVVIKMIDCRSLQYCSQGVREFFKRHNLDYSEFLKNGLPATTMLEGSNYDAMVVALKEQASGRK